MKEKLRNTLNLSKLYIKENDTNLNIINFETRKFNKKSLLFWIYVILFFAMFYLSSEIIDYAIKIGKPQIFLNGFLLFLQILIILRTIMVSMNVFYFSKEIENILHLPLKPIEILISKFNTILFMNYEIELIIAFMPLLIYGIYTHAGILFFINLIFILMTFPIFSILVVSAIMTILMKTIKLFKNKDLMQLIISFALVFSVMFIANTALNYVFQNIEQIEKEQEIILNNINEKIIKINNYFININPSAKILQEKNTFLILFNYLKLVFINLIAFLFFIYVGNKLYLKQLLKANFYIKNKKTKKLNLNKKSKKNKIINTFIKKEFKLLFKNPLFFIQCIYPAIMMTVLFSVLLIAIIPKFYELMTNPEFKDILENMRFDIEAICIIIGGLQVVGLFNYSSVTAFSREGKEAFLIKTLPVSLYKQYIYKNIPQIYINTICSIILCTIIAIEIPAIKIEYICIIFALSLFLTIINSFVLSLIDLIMPKLDWDAEYEILKNNKNKLLQYVLIVLNVLFLIYIKKIFVNIDLNKALIVFGGILIIIFSIINFVVFRFRRKFYKKIL